LQTHSFPTRRSSDLGTGETGAKGDAGGTGGTGAAGNTGGTGATGGGGAAVSGNTGYIQYNTSNALDSDINFAWDHSNQSLNIGQATLLTNNPLAISGTAAGYVQSNIQNKSADQAASTDFVMTADNGSDTTNYVNIGINSSAYNLTAYDIVAADDGYVYAQGGNIAIGTSVATKVIKLHTGGTRATNLSATVDDSGINLPTGKTFRINGMDLQAYITSIALSMGMGGF
jgi:hypothetical protein